MNRLADESSPYLRQHQDNPVDWFPWTAEAFAKARAEDKPVLLSVGYSACHWCHVMAHESFEDDEVAASMNAKFVSVKVDREERPDVDAVYMDAVQAINGHGGWPMTVFLTPDGQPFFGGTYFPKPAFLQLLAAVDEAWHGRRDELLGQAGRLTEALDRTATLEPAETVPGVEHLDQALTHLAGQFDREWGGFGGAPKFPQSMSLELLLRAHRTNASPETLAVVTTSLDAMAVGGIYDHLGGGFARYSVDRQWTRAPLREDALRPGPADPRVPARVAAHRRGPLPPGGRRDRGVRAAATWGSRRAGSRPRRTPTRSGPTATAARAGSTPGRPRRSPPCSATRRSRRRRSTGTASPRRGTSRTARSCGARSAASCSGRRSWRRRAAACSRPGPPGPGPGSTTRSSRSGTR